MKRTVLAAVLIQGVGGQTPLSPCGWRGTRVSPFCYEDTNGDQKARARKILEWRGRGNGEESVGQSPVNQSSIGQPTDQSTNQSRVKQGRIKQTSTGKSPFISSFTPRKCILTKYKMYSKI